MTVVVASPETNTARERFFRAIFGEGSGFVCVATREPKGKFEEFFFRYPNNLEVLLDFVNRQFYGRNLYFCPQLLSAERRVKGSVRECRVVWADLDSCKWDIVQPEPSLALETSPGRYQAFWFLDDVADPFDVEDAAHRIAHAYKEQGVDQSGWDLTQLLRIPLTYNQKYATTTDTPVVRIVHAKRNVYSVTDFQKMPQVPGYEILDEPFPDTVLELDADEILRKYRNVLDPQVLILYSEEPPQDWSGVLFNLECMLLEAGVTKEETFAVCNNAACNKWGRDGRSPIFLWKDVLRASTRVASRLAIAAKPASELPTLLTDQERQRIDALPQTFVEEFVDWARSRGDAAWQYFEAGAFTILSCLLSGKVKLPTSFGVMVPNLWFMILADTTLTRKSTAMDMAMELLLSVEPDAVLATDGSMEGLMTAIATRPGKPGVFWRDEFSGLLAAIKQKDYLAGMVETLTKLYDGKYQKRILRKEVVEIVDPILIIFAGGIRTKILELMDTEHVVSGFAPRFIFVQAQSDINNFRPIGPMTEEGDQGRTELTRHLMEIQGWYSGEMTIHIGDQEVRTNKEFNAHLSSEAWARYNLLEKTMVESGLESNAPEIFTPTMDRLAKSILKCSVLLAACKEEPRDNKVQVTLDDMLKAIKFAEKWRDWALDVCLNVGKTVTEKRIDAVLKVIQTNNGVTRSKVMQNQHLTSREADWILETLDQRGLIRRVRGQGDRTERLFPAVVR